MLSEGMLYHVGIKSVLRRCELNRSLKLSLSEFAFVIGLVLPHCAAKRMRGERHGLG